MTAAIIDYGSGNLHSAAKALERAAADSGLGVLVTADPEAVARALGISETPALTPIERGGVASGEFSTL